MEIDADRRPPASPGFSVREFADLDDGRRVWWRDDRGWGGSVRCSTSEWPVGSGRDLVAEVIQVTGGHERTDEYVTCAMWALREMGTGVDPASVWAAPYVVEFGPLLETELRRVSGFWRPSDPPTPPPDWSPPDPGGDRAVSV